MDDVKVDEIFEFVENSNVTLDEDPIRRGPKYLNKMVAETRNLTNQVQRYERDLAKEKLVLERRLNKLETEFELKSNDLLANDASVLRKSSVRDREAAVNDMLKELRTEVLEYKNQLVDLGHVETVVKSKLRELKDVNRDIRLQMRLIEDEIEIGNYWGDQSDNPMPISAAEIDVEDVLPPELEEEGVQAEDAEFTEVFGETPDGDPVETSEKDEEDFDSALDSITDSKKSGKPAGPPENPALANQDFDFEDLLEGL